MVSNSAGSQGDFLMEITKKGGSLTYELALMTLKYVWGKLLVDPVDGLESRTVVLIVAKNAVGSGCQKTGG